MTALSDKLLSSGCGVHVEAIHGDVIRIISGADAGKSFFAVLETESDFVLTTELGEDPRSKTVLRFRTDAPQGLPNIGSQDVIETADGQRWTAVRHPRDGYLTTDYELREIISGKDTL